MTAGDPAGSLLAADLEGGVVILDPERGTLHRLDAQSAAVWRACSGRAADEVSREVAMSVDVVSTILSDLESLGIATRSGGRWTGRLVEWV